MSQTSRAWFGRRCLPSFDRSRALLVLYIRFTLLLSFMSNTDIYGACERAGELTGCTRTICTSPSPCSLCSL